MKFVLGLRPGVCKIFFARGQRVNILCFVGYMVSNTTNQFCCCNVRATIENTYTDKRHCALIKIYLRELKYELNIIFTCHEILVF